MSEGSISGEIRQRLFTLQDTKYQAFQAALIPNLPSESVIGVRIPALRKLAKEYAKREETAEFLRELPHTYYEENNLHGFLIETIRDYEAAIEALEAFLPYIDNWATCDSTAPKVFGAHLEELTERIRVWLRSDHAYTVRYGIGMLMRYYLDAAFRPEYPELVLSVSQDDYYVKMMQAWYFATALAKQYEAVLPYLEERRMERWTHNRTIQKAVESFRVPQEHKAYLRTLRRSANEE